MTYCPKCHASIPDRAMRFCAWCGAALPAATEEEVDSEAAPKVENTDGPPAISQKDFDDAMAIDEESERIVEEFGQMTTPIGIELLISSMLIACIYPVVWGLVVMYFVTSCTADVHRMAAKKALKAHDVPAANSAIGKAKSWMVVFALTEVAMGLIELWAFFKLVGYLKGG